MTEEITLEEIIQFLLETPIFRNLNESELAEIIKILYPRRTKKGETIFIEWDRGDAVYVIYKGRVKVLKKFLKEEEHEIAVLDRRNVFGEMALIDGMQRSATVIAEEDTICFEIRKKDFDRLINRDNIAALKLTYHIAQIISRRNRSTEKKISGILSNLSESLGTLVERIDRILQKDPWVG